MRVVGNGRRSGAGFTLIELAMVTVLGVVVAALLMALTSQQLAFLRIYSAQNFLIDEAPIVSLHVSRLIAKADRFRLHASVDDALNGRNARLSDSPVLLLNFQQPDGSVRAGILSFEVDDDETALYYYLIPRSREGALAEPEWAITRKAADVSFFLQEGILRMRLTGSGGEEVTYSGTMQR